MNNTKIVLFNRRNRGRGMSRRHGTPAEAARVLAFKPARVETRVERFANDDRKQLLLAVLGLPRDFQALMFKKMPEFYAACGLGWPQGA